MDGGNQRELLQLPTPSHTLPPSYGAVQMLNQTFQFARGTLPCYLWLLFSFCLLHCFSGALNIQDRTGLLKWCSACCVWGGCHAFVVGVMPLLWVSWHYGVCHAFVVCVMPYGACHVFVVGLSLWCASCHLGLWCASCHLGLWCASCHLGLWCASCHLSLLCAWCPW